MGENRVSLIIEILPMVFSLIMGAATTHWKQTSEDLHNERMHAIKATEAARKDKSKGTSWSRKFIVQSVIGSLFIFPMCLTILNYIGNIYGIPPIAIYIPQEIMYGGLFSLLWSKDTIQYIPIYGFVLMPIHIMMTQLLGGYYFGASAMRR